LSYKINQILKYAPGIKNTQPYLLNDMLQQTLDVYNEASNG